MARVERVAELELNSEAEPRATGLRAGLKGPLVLQAREERRVLGARHDAPVALQRHAARVALREEREADCELGLEVAAARRAQRNLGADAPVHEETVGLDVRHDAEQLRRRVRHEAPFAVRKQN